MPDQTEERGRVVRRRAALLGRVMGLLLFLLLRLILPVSGSGAVVYGYVVLMAACYVPAALDPRNLLAWRLFFALAIPIALLQAMGLTGQAYRLGLALEHIPLAAYLLAPIVALAGASCTHMSEPPAIHWGPSTRPAVAFLFAACSTVLVVTALAHLAIWVWPAYVDPGRWLRYPNRYLWRAIISIAFVGPVVLYSLYAGLYRRWIHGLCIYAIISALLLSDPGYRYTYWYLMLPTVASVEALFVLPRFTRSPPPWYPHLLRAHIFLIPAWIVSGLLVSFALPPSSVSVAPEVLAWFSSGFFAMNALNLRLARLIVRRPPLWGYGLGGLEALGVLLVSGGYALLVVSHVGA